MDKINIDDVRDQIKDALEGDSNDAEHDALAMVADVLGIEWRSPYADDDADDHEGSEFEPFEPSPDPNWMNP